MKITIELTHNEAVDLAEMCRWLPTQADVTYAGACAAQKLAAALDAARCREEEHRRAMEQWHKERLEHVRRHIQQIERMRQMAADRRIWS